MTISLVQERLTYLFEYKDGSLFWKNPTSNRVQKGTRAGTVCNTTGYRRVQVDGKAYQEHRVIFMYHYGSLPDIIDHIDRDKVNNKIENLRASTKSLNGHNNNHTNVFYDQCSWRSRIKVAPAASVSKRFKTKEEAVTWRDEVVSQWYGDLKHRIGV